jgi:hypothetical protein
MHFKSLFLGYLPLASIVAAQQNDPFAVHSLSSAISRSTFEDMCISETESNYMNTMLPDPFIWMSFESDSTFPDCTPKNYDGSIVMVCDFDSSYMNHMATSTCNEVGGNLLLINVKARCEEYDNVNNAEFHNVPLCIGQSCDPTFVIDILNAEYDTPMIEGCQMTFVPTVPKACKEDPNAQFLLNNIHSQNRWKKCKWLKRNVARAHRHCSDVTHIPYYSAISAASASEMCPQTCSLTQKFVLFSNAFPRKKSCAWLTRQTERKQKRICDMHDLHGDYPSASEMCPTVCGQC